jgi:hypothetical protein
MLTKYVESSAANDIVESTGVSDPSDYNYLKQYGIGLLITAIIVIACLVIMTIAAVMISRGNMERAGSVLRKFDLFFSLQHPTPPGESPIKKSTVTGGLLSLGTITLNVTYFVKRL